MLLGQPRLLLGAVAAMAVLGFVASTPAAYVSSVSSASLQRQIDASCRGVGVDPSAGPPIPPELLLAAPADLASRASPAFATRIETVASRLNGFGVDGGPAINVLMVHRTGYPEALHPLAGGGDGVWIPDTVAEEIGLGVGDQVRLGPDGDLVAVAAIYPDLLTTRQTDQWSCALRDTLGFNVDPNSGVAPAVFVPRDVFFDHMVLHPGDYGIEWPFAELPTTLSQARHAVEALPALDAAVASSMDLGGRIPSASSRLPFMTERAAAIRSAVSSTITPTAILAVVATLVLVAGFGRFWLDKRRAEVRLLWARGVAPSALGLLAVAELLVATVAGAIAGWALGLFVVRRAGPSGALDPGVAATCLAWAGAMAAVALVVVWLSVTLGTRSILERAPERSRRAWRWVRVVPWEPVVLAGAWLAWRRLVDQGPAVVDGDSAPAVDFLALLFPLLLIIGVLGLLARVLRVALGAGRRRGRWLPVQPLLAVRRMAAARATTLTTMMAAALGVGVVTFSAGAVVSTQATADAKSGVAAGADIWAIIGAPDDAGPPLPGRSTIVGFDSGATFGDVDVDVRIVDPATFADGAYWPDAGGPALEDLLARLDGPLVDGAIPVLAVGDTPSAGPWEAGGVHRSEATLTVVARPAFFPTQDASRPTLIMAAGRLPDYDGRVERRVLASGATRQRAAHRDRRPAVGPRHARRAVELRGQLGVPADGVDVRLHRGDRCRRRRAGGRRPRRLRRLAAAPSIGRLGTAAPHGPRSRRQPAGRRDRADGHPRCRPRLRHAARLARPRRHLQLAGCAAGPHAVGDPPLSAGDDPVARRRGCHRRRRPERLVAAGRRPVEHGGGAP